MRHDQLDEPALDWRAKGFWQPDPPVPDAVFAAAGHSLFGGAVTWPVLAVRRSAVAHNVATMADFCTRHGFSFAPHGKTTMAPSLLDAQLAAGAWAITMATASQLLACRALGVPRVLLANELLDPTPLRWLAGELDRGFEAYFFVDSVAGVEAIATALADQPGEAPLRVLVELGFPGGRAGCRTVEQVVEVAEAVAATPRVRLDGVAGYEGGLPDDAAVTAYLRRLRAAATELARRRLVGPEVLVSAGGSAWFDLVAEELGGDWLAGHDLRVVLRSGAYVTHDHGFYAEHTPFHRIPGEGGLDAALELWAQVTSTPEPGLAIVGMGKRDASYDEGLPVPLRVRRRSGEVHAVEGMSVDRLNDHHGYLAVPPGVEVHPGDLVCFGISHPCTAFDKWRAMPVVDDDHVIVDVLRTYF
ncbi:alanine racemase [Plantactinospora endophytica]|uniref:Amino acid deaminase n=1 Tax=Plantactinospora endophytica TaxID=673535 RepID=A0ABQ4E1V1_9ACTN|nr:alanine racemase [Plantactinospora endophytica]GIG88276.1 amino acid deaminase [Plantactinospora endophytica]